MSTVVYPFQIQVGQRGRFRMRLPADGQGKGRKKEVPVGTTPRITKLMALAIRFEGLVQSGPSTKLRVCHQVRDYAEIARLGHVTRARVSQIMSLSRTLSVVEGLNLTPDIQEAILFLPKTVRGRDPICARDVIRLAAEVDWARQRGRWGAES